MCQYCAVTSSQSLYIPSQLLYNSGSHLSYHYRKMFLTRIIYSQTCANGHLRITATYKASKQQTDKVHNLPLNNGHFLLHPLGCRYRPVSLYLNGNNIVVSKLLKTIFFLQIHELRNGLDQAVADQEFLKAQEWKEKIDSLESVRVQMEASLQSSDVDTLKRYATSKTSLKIISSVTSRFD